MKQIAFEKETHSYFEVMETGRRSIPSVTEILRETGAIEGANFMKAWHADRGSKVHLACYLDDEGTLDEGTIDPEIAPYLAAYREWKVRYQPKILRHECVVHHDELDYCGTCDLVVIIKLNGREVEIPIDIKSGHRAPWHIIQVAGYSMALYGQKWLSHPMAALYLRPKKNPPYSFAVYDLTEQMTAGADFVRRRIDFKKLASRAPFMQKED